MDPGTRCFTCETNSAQACLAAMLRDSLALRSSCCNRKTSGVWKRARSFVWLTCKKKHGRLGNETLVKFRVGIFGHTCHLCVGAHTHEIDHWPKAAVLCRCGTQNLACIQLDGASFLASLFRSSTRYSTVLVTPVLKVFHCRLGFRRIFRTDCSSCSA